jgi:hypothetical protein
MSSDARGQFRCPSDSWSFRDDVGRSYLLNSGTRFRIGDDYRNGFQLMGRPRSPSEFIDGQSTTAALAERLVAPYLPDVRTAQSDPKRFLWWTKQAVAQAPGNEPAFIEACRNDRVSVVRPWLFAADTAGNGYDHF